MQLSPFKTTTLDLLIAARALIDHGWCQGASAKNKAGIPVQFMEPTAVQFCASGALCRLMNYIFEPHRKAREILCEVVGTKHLDLWNDYQAQSKDDVLVAFDKAIEIARQQTIDTNAQIE